MKAILLTGCFVLSLIALRAQENISPGMAPEVFPFGVIERIESVPLAEARVLNIWLPQGFDPDSSLSYPVIYVLDGSAHEDFPHIAGLVQFLNMYELMPKSIVVGIANVDRYRDFTHTTTARSDLKAIPNAGGSEKFIRFLATEVQPLIERNYPTNGQSTIIGQSLGGLLATEILMKQPELFDDYIIVSPSLWWDNQSLVKGAASYFAGHPELQKRVFVSLGEEHRTMHKVADELVAAIRDSGNKKMKVYYEPILTEDHATILHRAVYRGFELLYAKK